MSNPPDANTRFPRRSIQLGPLAGAHDRRRLALACLLALLLACSERSSSAGSDGSAKPESAAAAASDASPAAASGEASSATSGKPPARLAPRHPNERPIPAFSGQTLTGTSIDARQLIGSRSVFFFFNPEVDEAVAVARGVERVNAVAADHNFRIVGVGIGSDTEKLASFVGANGLSFPVIDDSSGAITSKLGLRSPLGLVGVDPEGYMLFGLGSFPTAPDLEKQVESNLRKSLRIEEAAGGAQAGALIHHPDAPALGVVALSDGKVLETKMLAGHAAIVIFFLHTCPHCHHALEAIREILAKFEGGEKPRLVAVSIHADAAAVRGALAEKKLDFFDPYLDPGGKAADAWGITGGVPVVHVVDPKGRIRARIEGWSGARDAGMLRMQVAQASGAKVPMLLDPDGYSGNDVCGICHEQEHAAWRFTAHSTAYATLVTHGADRRTDCVGCHVVGFEKPGGYDFTTRAPALENVGCESCHGRGGPHLSPGFVKAGDYAAVCSTCHNPTHSLGFDYASFHPRISHARIAALPDAERATLRGSGPERELLPSKAAYVGSNACRSCHAKEFETWSNGPHAHAVATLEKAGKQDQSDCLACHTTAYGKPGGFAKGASVKSAPDLARVGCESCHGPGGDHVGESATRVGTILSLGDKCDSCVIQKVCGTCHDKANDPGFEFAVEKRIDAQRHGSIVSAASRAAGAAAP